MGSDNGLMLNKCQDFIWTFHGLVHWCLYASFSLNEIYKTQGRFKDVNELLNLRALKFSPLYKYTVVWAKYFMRNFTWPLKFHTRYVTHTSKDMYNTDILTPLAFKSSYTFLPSPHKLCQCYGYWCPSNPKCQSINRHNTDYEIINKF